MEKLNSKSTDETSNSDFQRTAIVYLILIGVSIFTSVQLFDSVFPQGLAAEEGCEKIWEALGFAASSSDDNSFSRRVGIVWECGEKVRGLGALSIYCFLWIALKALAIPGSMILSVALGGLIPPIQAQTIASVCEIIGGSLCYFISGFIGKPLLTRFSPVLLSKFQAQTDAKRKTGDLFYFSLFARMTPLIPNWFVNAASPIVGIPYYIYVTTLFLGIQIATFLSIRTGALLFALGNDTANGDSFLNGQALQNFIILLLSQFLALAPLYLFPSQELQVAEASTKSDQVNRKDE